MRKQVRVNFPHENIKPGDVIWLEFKEGIPVDPFWRRRWADKDVDSCVELVEKPKKKGEDK